MKNEKCDGWTTYNDTLAAVLLNKNVVKLDEPRLKTVGLQVPDVNIDGETKAKKNKNQCRQAKKTASISKARKIKKTKKTKNKKNKNKILIYKKKESSKGSSIAKPNPGRNVPPTTMTASRHWSGGRGATFPTFKGVDPCFAMAMVNIQSGFAAVNGLIEACTQQKK